MMTMAAAARSGMLRRLAAAPAQCLRLSAARPAFRYTRIAAMGVGGVGLGLACAASEPAVRADGSCDTATIAAVAVVGVAAAAYASGGLGGGAAAIDTDQRYMIDCGSGWTRIEKYGVRSDGNVYLEHGDKLEAAPLADALAKGEAAQIAWLSALAAAIGSDDTSTPIFIGATAGVRDAIATKAVTEESLAAFQKLVSAKLGPNRALHTAPPRIFSVSEPLQPLHSEESLTAISQRISQEQPSPWWTARQRCSKMMNFALKMMNFVLK